MKKRFWGILIVVVIFAIGLPRITSDGLSSLSSPEEKEEVEQYNKRAHRSLFRPLDRLMVQSYEAKANGHQWDATGQKSVKNYRITYYTFFGIRYMEAELSSAGGTLRWLFI